MGYAFSKRSAERLASCDHHLRILMEEVVKHRDCAIVCGRRRKEEQDRAYAEGKSKKRYPESKHNGEPSLAVDVVPCINGKASFDRDRCYHFAGVVMGIAIAMGMGKKIRWGGDWDGDHDVKDQTFNDLVHFEIVG